MTEASPNLLSAVFSPQPKGISRNSASMGESGREANSDNAFSRELSRANGKQQSTRSTAAKSQQDDANTSNDLTENADPAASKLGDSSQKQTQTTSDSKRSVNTSASKPEKTTSSDVDKMHTTESTNSDDATLELSEQFGESELEEAVVADVAAMGSIVDPAEVASLVVDTVQTDTEKPAALSTVKMNGLDAGIELMPAQLHAHQLQQLNRAEASQTEDIASDITLTEMAKVTPTGTPPIAVAAQISSSAVLAVASKVQIEGQSVSSAATLQANSEQVTPALEDIDPMVSLSAQRSLTLSDTLADAKQLAQQAFEQKQALEVDHARLKQVAQQQALASVSVNANVQEAGESSPDNMLQSTLGGIVTTPAMQRTDAGNAQLTTAPANVPILQGDSEKAMVSNIRWMVNENVKQAVVNVTPSGMGPISVSIGLENEQMNISIVAAQGSTREALDSMLPRLREQLVAQGHDGVKVDISDGRSENSGNGYDRHATNPEQGEGAEQESENPSTLADQTRKNENSVVETAATNDKEGFLLVDRNGQIRGGYDVYV